MEENNNNNFEVISSKTSNANFKQNQRQNNFGKTVLIPFASGVVGCSLVLISYFI